MLEAAIGIAASILASLIALLFRRFGRWLRELIIDVVAAAAERYRIRENRRRRALGGRRASSQPSPEQPEHIDEETTDMHELIELEREHRVRRKTDRQQKGADRRGERAPRPGTHHD